MSHLNPSECLICQEKRAEVLCSYDLPDKYELIVGVKKDGYKREWVKCCGCGLHYSRYSREAGVIDKIYANAYRSENSPWRGASTEEIFEKATSLPKDESETNFRVTWIKNMIQSMEQEGIIRGMSKNQTIRNLLDIGGGNGIFAHGFQDNEWKSHVIDPSENSNFIKEKLGIDFVQGFYEPGKFNCTFDLLSLVFVLEHMADPKSFLEEVKKDMGTDSLLYIEIPDSICFLYKSKTDDIFNSCHLWMFSPNTLTHLLDTCGFEVFSMKRTKTKRGHYSLMALAGKKAKIGKKGGSMDIKKAAIEGVFEITPTSHHDNRGFLVRLYDDKIFKEFGLNAQWVQESHSHTIKKYTVRGLHVSLPSCLEGKAISITRGKVLWVVVDLRKDSPTFGKAHTTILSDELKNTLYVERGFAHGSMSLSDDCDLVIKADNYFTEANSTGIVWNDPSLNIDWGLQGQIPIVKERDQNYPTFEDFLKKYGAIDLENDRTVKGFETQ